MNNDITVKLQFYCYNLLINVKNSGSLQQEFVQPRYLTNVHPMLEYTKTILRKVSFSPFLFRKELTKSFKWLQKEEIRLLQGWCLLTFGDVYADIIMESFKGI